MPKGVRIYAIGDIHGRADLLERMLNRIDAHLASIPFAIRSKFFSVIISIADQLHAKCSTTS